MNTLSIQRPLPSMETLMPASVKMPVNLGLVNWPPWKPFYVSSSELCLVDVTLSPSDDGKDLPGDVALEAANSF